VDHQLQVVQVNLHLMEVDQEDREGPRQEDKADHNLEDRLMDTLDHTDLKAAILELEDPLCMEDQTTPEPHLEGLHMEGRPMEDHLMEHPVGRLMEHLVGRLMEDLVGRLMEDPVGRLMEGHHMADLGARLMDILDLAILVHPHIIWDLEE